MLSPKILPPVRQYTIERYLTRQALLPEERGVGTSHQAPQPLGSTPEI